MKEAAFDYVLRGFAVFPCRQKGKEPATANGLNDAVTDATGVEKLWGRRLGLNIGIATGAVSGIFVVDIDGAEGEQSLGELIENHGALPATLESTTGKGRHLVFRHPGNRVGSSTSKIAPHIDIRGDGGYIVAPPSIHPSGRAYHWVNETAGIAEAPAWIVELANQVKVRDAIVVDPELYRQHSYDGWTVDEVSRMLAVLDPDMPYDEWLRVGMALHVGGYSLAVWDQWSQSGDKYQSGCTMRRWMGFKGHPGGVTMGTLVDMAKLHGWSPQVEREPVDPTNVHGVDITGLLQKGRVPVETIVQTNVAKSVGVLGFDPMGIDGVIGETVRWIVSGAVKPQPELAFMNTLAALGAVFGRRYRSPFDTRTNLYIVGIAGTGAGKDASRRAIKNLLVTAGLERFVGGDSIVSGQGLLYGLKTQASQLLHLDEFGMLMQAITDQKGAHYMRVVGKVLTELYSSSASVYHGGNYADANKEPVIIHSPNLCIYGTSTLEKYAEAINRSAIASGELNRFIVLPVTQERPTRRREIASNKPRADLIERWQAFGNMPAAGNLTVGNDRSSAVPEALTVWWPGQDDRIHEMGLLEDEMLDTNEADGTGPLWNRYRENVIKIAMILAIARNHHTPVMEAADLDVAEMTVRASIEYMQSVALNHMADSQHERDRQDVLRAIKVAGGSITRRDLFRALRTLDKRRLEDVLIALQEAEDVTASIDTEAQGAGRRATIYRL